MPSPITALSSLIHATRMFSNAYKYADRAHQRQAVSRIFLLGTLLAQAFVSAYYHDLVDSQTLEKYMYQKVSMVLDIHSAVVGKNQARYQATVASINRIPLTTPTRLLLHHHQTSARYWPGQRVEVTAKIRELWGHANPGKRSMVQWAASQSIQAIADIDNAVPVKVIRPSTRLHTMISLAIRYSGSDHHHWIRALIAGDRSDLQFEDWALLKRTGTAHVFTVSGMHLSIVISFIYLLCRVAIWLVITFFPSTHQYPWKGIAVFICIGFVWWYATLANMQLPVVRASIMATAFLFSLITPFCWTHRHRFMLMVTACLLLFPMSVLSASFYLSVGAVAIIFLHLHRWPRLPSSTVQRLLAFIRFQCTLSLLLSPVLLIWFDGVSYVSFFVNLLLIPLVTLLLPLCFLITLLYVCSPAIVSGAFSAVDTCMAYLLHCLKWADALSHSYDVETQGLNSLVVAVSLLWGLALVLRMRQCITLGVFAVALVAHHSLLMTPSPHWQLHVFDVGHGTAAMITRNGRAVFIDTGPGNKERDESAMERVIIPSLTALGVTHIDAIFVSHGDSDHSGGLEALKRHINRHQKTPAAVFTNLDGCRKGREWSWQALTFTMLWPMDGHDDSNDTSCVVRVSDSHHSALFTGDISKTVEYQLLYADALQTVDVVIAPHHGSRTSSSAAFVRALAPTYVVFTHALWHRWTFPDPEVVARYVDTGATMVSTALQGYSLFEFLPNNTIRLRTFREHIRPRWYEKAKT